MSSLLVHSPHICSQFSSPCSKSTATGFATSVPSAALSLSFWHACRNTPEHRALLAVPCPPPPAFQLSDGFQICPPLVSQRQMFICRAVLRARAAVPLRRDPAEAGGRWRTWCLSGWMGCGAVASLAWTEPVSEPEGDPDVEALQRARTATGCSGRAGWEKGSSARTNGQLLVPSYFCFAYSKGGCQGLQPCNGAVAFSCQKNDLDSTEKFTSDKILVLGCLGYPWACGNTAGAGKEGWRHLLRFTVGLRMGCAAALREELLDTFQMDPH